MYTTIDFSSKKAIKEALAAGKTVTLYQPGPFGGDPNEINGTVYLEGPHYPKPHRWYASGKAVNGVLVSIK